ncbi:hypothetical protein DFH08DRAFT_182122 [Mycena albidolilacea]|uniref:Uncharacterized protein n=1 Tax=Mycena albidolilacea TaxID=1033008 RepID=A0AAD7F325_9AGAR|nr:hypothetical protein DFH08DRAFT_182122 [Mycena albidolilacea]
MDLVPSFPSLPRRYCRCIRALDAHRSKFRGRGISGNPQTVSRAFSRMQNLGDPARISREQYHRVWSSNVDWPDCCRTSESHMESERTWPGGADMLGLFRDAAAPQLQQLEVIHISDEDQFPNPDCAVGFFSSGAPRLSSLKIDEFTLQAVAQRRATLTHLDMRRPEHTLSAINQYLSLAHLRLDMGYVAMDTTPLRLPTLKSLDLWIPEDGEDYLAWILEHFDLPTLTELTVGGGHGDQIALLFSRTSFLGSNFPALASVSFVFRDSCSCETDPDHLTPINFQCFTHTLIQDILGPASHL